MVKENLYDELKVNMTAMYFAYYRSRHCEAVVHRMYRREKANIIPAQRAGTQS